MWSGGDRGCVLHGKRAGRVTEPRKCSLRIQRRESSGRPHRRLWRGLGRRSAGVEEQGIYARVVPPQGCEGRHGGRGRFALLTANRSVGDRDTGDRGESSIEAAGEREDGSQIPPTFGGDEQREIRVAGRELAAVEDKRLGRRAKGGKPRMRCQRRP